MPFEFILPLARISGLFEIQNAEVLKITENGVSFHKSAETLRSIPFAEIKSFKLVHSKAKLSGMFNALLGSLWYRNEWRVEIESEAGNFRLPLELNIMYRSNEVREMLKMLYANEVNVEEITRSGVKTYLLE